MDISVIICTYNRSNQLRNLLMSLSEQILPEGLKWEVIIVDNNSKDDTRRVVDQIQGPFSLPIKYLFEPRQGKSYALNTGMQEALGGILAFTDDDIILDRHWIEIIYRSFKKQGCDGLCGKIFLKLPEEKPRWLSKDLWGFLGYLDYGDKPLFINNEDIFGGNVAYTRNAAEKAGLFDVNLGRAGSRLTGKEDVEYGRKVIREGGRVLYEPNLKVFHMIEPWKLKRRYFLKLHYYAGIVSSRYHDRPVERGVFGVPLFLYPQFLRSILRYLGKPTVRMQMNIWWYLGFMKGSMTKYNGKDLSF